MHPEFHRINLALTTLPRLYIIAALLGVDYYVINMLRSRCRDWPTVSIAASLIRLES